MGPRIPTQITCSTSYLKPSKSVNEKNCTVISVKKRKYDQIDSGIEQDSDFLPSNVKFKVLSE